MTKSNQPCAQHRCSGHDQTHQHALDCGHTRVLHGDHYDYVVDGHRHYVHEGHCDDHGTVN